MKPEHAPLPPDLGPLRSQDTLEPLIVRDGLVTTASGSRSYPVREGLVFMGFAAGTEDLIRETAEEERRWQGTPDLVRRDEEFLMTSAPQAVGLINVVRHLTGHRPGLRMLELGSGSGWVSWLAAQAGFDTYICDFEPNSLYSGWIYDHAALAPGKRIVADARYAPFADASFDVVLLKEFAHHVADTRALFAEANRVLKPGGLLAMQEYTRTVVLTLYELRHPDPHAGHHVTWPDRYLAQLRGAGFRRRWFTVAYAHESRHRAVRALYRRAARNVAGLRNNRSLFTELHFRVLGGGSMIYVGSKVRDAPPVTRPAFLPIDPSSLTLAAPEREAWSGCRRIVEQSARELR